VNGGQPSAVEANRDRSVVEIAECLELRVDRRLAHDEDLGRLLGEEPGRGVVVVRGHVEEEAAGRRRVFRLGRPHVASDAEDEERPADRALGDASPRLRPPSVVAPVVADLHDALRVRRRRGPDALVVGDSGRARLLEEEVLPGAQHRPRPHGVIDRARSDDHGVDVLGREQPLVRRRPDSELGRGLGRALGAGRRDRDEAGAVEASRVAGVDGPHPAQSRNSESQHP
jgi:hypothetical protein